MKVLKCLDNDTARSIVEIAVEKLGRKTVAEYMDVSLPTLSRYLNGARIPAARLQQLISRLDDEAYGEILELVALDIAEKSIDVFEELGAVAGGRKALRGDLALLIDELLGVLRGL